MLRVLQVMSGAEVGGAETFFVDLTTALHRAGLEQRVAIRSNQVRAEALRQRGLDPVELPFRRYCDFTTRRVLARQIEEFCPAIVQTWMARASAVPIRGDFIHVGWVGGYYDLKYFYHCDELIGVTKDLARHAIRNGWLRERSHYLPTFAADEPSPPLIRESLGTPGDAPLILALGRLHDDKGFDILLKALAGIPAAHLWLAGAGPLEKQLKHLTAELGLEPRVRFLGWRNDRAALYASCDMCVMPSRVEPFGTVMIEAWAYRCPIIAAKAKGPSALIKHGENGLLVPIDDAAALTAAICALIDNPSFALALAASGRSAYEPEYTESAVVERYFSFYNRLVSAESGRKMFVAL